MKPKFLSVLLFFASTAAFAQTVEIPENPTLISKEDYEAQEPTVLAAIDWLMKTPPQEQAEKRMEVNGYLLKWMTGTKAVSMGIDGQILTFMESSPDLLMIFMGGWAKYAMETKEPDNQLEGNKHGINAVIDYYVKFAQPSTKDKNVEKYVKMRREGTLEAFIAKKVGH